MRFINHLTPHGIALLVFLAYFLLVVVDVRHHAWRDPGSYFFDPKHAFERHYSLTRENESESFVKSALEAGNAEYKRVGENPSFCVGITTVQREGARYFRRALGSVLAGLTEKERADMHVISFIVNPDPTEHQAYNETWMSLLSDQVLTYEDADEEVKASLQNILDTSVDSKKKALFDYWYLLRTCYEKGTDWIVMLEDDTVAADGWYLRTRKAVEELHEKTGLHKSVYLRLFYNERLLGWNSEEWLGYTIRSIILEVVLLAALVAASRYIPMAATVLTMRTIATICFVLAPMCIGLFFAAGRITAAGPSRGLSRMDTYGCCSQAFVFPREQVSGLLAWYEENRDGLIDPVTHADKTQVDTLTEIYANNNGLARWALTPSVFQHVGGQSTKPTSITYWGRSNTENIWNFSFEKFDAKELKKDHVG